MSGKRVLKWHVPVDDDIHPIGWGRVVLVDCQVGPDVLSVWTEESDQISELFGSPARPVQVFGTGQEVPDQGEHLGSVMVPVRSAPNGTFVWHLYGLPRTPEEP